MENGVGLSLSLAWEGQRAAQQAARWFSLRSAKESAADAGMAVEYMAKAVVAHRYGPSAVLELKPGRELTPDERWVLGDRGQGDVPPTNEQARLARSSLLDLRSISGAVAVKRVSAGNPAFTTEVLSAIRLVTEARNSVVHLGGVELALEDLADSFVLAIETLLAGIPFGRDRLWGNYEPVARKGTLGRRDSIELDRDVRLILAKDHFYGLGVSYLRRREMVATGSRVRCPICNAQASITVARTAPPAPIEADADGSVLVMDCTVCGLELWADQIPQGYRR